MEISKLYPILHGYEILLYLANRISKFDEKSCNSGLTKNEEDRMNKLLALADKIAIETFKARIYHQSDPRGCSLYLVDSLPTDDYSKGLAIYREDIAKSLVNLLLADMRKDKSNA